MMIDANTNRSELEMAILDNKALYASLEEAKLLDGGYSTDELRSAVISWIEAGDECAA